MDDTAGGPASGLLAADDALQGLHVAAVVLPDFGPDQRPVHQPRDARLRVVPHSSFVAIGIT